MKEWDAFLVHLENEFGKNSVDKWLKSLTVENFDARNLHLKANNNFQISWFNEHIKPNLNAFLNSNGKKIKVHIEFDKLKKQQPQLTDNFSASFKFDDIDPFYHLSNFFFSEKDEITKKLISQLTGFCFLENKQKNEAQLFSTFNPIFIYGVKKSGKTHLSTAIAKQFLDLSYNVLYVNAETFTKHVVSAIRGSYMPLFRKRYRQADVLILEDIHLFANRVATQEEFFHTFNALHTLGKQIILTANCPPYSLSNIEPRLTSRFEWGISCMLEKLSSQDIEKAIELREKFLNISLLSFQKQFLLQHFKSPEKLFKALDIFVLRANDKIDKIDKDQTKTLLYDLLNEAKTTTLDSKKIISCVAAYFGIQENDIIDRNQSKEFTYPRQIAIYLIRHDLNLPFTKIGKILSRDHSTIMSSVKKIDLIKDAKAKDALEKIRNNY